jgi:hypothetical protein
MSLRVVHLHWSKNAPGSIQLNKIRQIVYRIETDGPAKRKGLIDVWADNVFAKSTGHWRWFPAVYSDHLLRIFYRLGLYFEILDFLALNRSASKSAAITELKIYINYIDKVLDDIWEETRIADQDNTLTATWRCPTLERWLLKEHTIGRHDEKSIRDASIEWNVDELGPFMTGNPMELGKHLLHPSVFASLLTKMNTQRLDRVRCQDPRLAPWGTIRLRFQ